MKNHALLIVTTILLLAGCSRPAIDLKDDASSSAESSGQHGSPASATGTFGDTLVVNSFGMRFVRVAIEPGRDVIASVSVPGETYYLQQTEVTGEHLDRLREFAKDNDIGPKDSLDIAISEWRDISNLAILMSKYDPKYDYGLPSRSQWVFACMSGYEQRCDEDRPNAYGIVDMLDGDVEVIDEIGILMGRWINNWGEHAGKPEPDCPCEHWTLCNPDADDSLNEIIVGRFILLPEGTVHTADE
ncbi:MAG: hypothetical protein U0795_12485 [Pirellulales bacterium]